MEQMSEILVKEFVYTYLTGVDATLANNFLTKIGEVQFFIPFSFI